MRKTLCLALPAMLAAACGDSGNAEPEKHDAGKQDAPPASLDVPAKLDQYIAPQPDLPNDVPLSPEVFPMPIDVPVDLPSPGLDGPDAKLDAMWTIEWDIPRAPPVDGPPDPVDATTRTLRSPDGRTWTVIMVDACYGGAISTDNLRNSPCTGTYAEGRDRAMTPLDASYAPGTAAGRCAEGSYVYAPYRQLETMYCYYDAVTQKLVGYRSGHDTTSECGKDGTASNSWAYGEIVPCSNITWEISRAPY